MSFPSIIDITQVDKLRILIDHLPDYIYFKDTESRFIDANKATLRIMKCRSLDDCIGKTDFDFYSREYAEKYYADEQEILQSGVSKLDIEEVTPDEKGRLGVYLTSKVVLKDDRGRVVGLVGIGREITDLKRAREVLERDNETLEKLVQERTKKLIEIQAEYDKAKRLSDIGTLAAIVGHELRNPLEVIKLALHQLKKNEILAENKYFMTIEQKLREGNRIIDNLLNYSRIKAPSYEKVNLLELVDDCIGVYPEEYQLTIEKKYLVPSNTMVEIDPYQIREVFVNIFNNACQALKSKTGKIEVGVIHISDEYFSVEFKDNGVGIDEKDLDKIFMPFFTSKAKGTGLGLAICRELVSLHQGHIEVHSLKGVGTTFQVVLPFKK